MWRNILSVFIFIIITGNVFAEDKSFVQVPLNDVRNISYVRVAVLKDAVGFDFMSVSDFYVYSYELKHKKYLFKMPALKINIYVKNGKIFLGDRIVRANKILIETRGNNFSVNSTAYRGSLIIVNKYNKLLLVNYIDIDDYLKGVLPSEIDALWSLEALKAQAVASRTYALFNEADSINKEYSLESNILSQVYKGINTETMTTGKAVDMTRGEVLTYKGKLFSAFFYACCGGYTENVERVWAYYPFKALEGHVDKFCQGTKHYFWQKRVSLDFIRERLNKRGIKVNKIHFIKKDKVDKTGRVLRFLVFAKGENIYIDGNRFRLFVGPEIIKSTKISKIRTIKYKGKNFIDIQGYGWGHGVGLCQWGAKVMAERGYNYKEILRYYYNGAEVVNINK